MTQKYSSNNAQAPQGPFKAVHRQDFAAHVEGNAFRHTAPSIDMSPSLPNYSATTVQATLEQINQAIIKSGNGFVSVGRVDGYAFGSYNVGGATTPTLASAIAAAAADGRLTDGGVILLMAGTYHTSSTITIPEGITLMGELAGTYIIGNMAEQPIFSINPSVKNIVIGSNSGGSDVNPIKGTAVGRCKLFNMILVDNMDGYGGTGVNATMTTVPMVQVKNGASLEVEKVTFLGRLNTGVALNRIKTKAAIGTTTGAATGTTIIIKDSYIDGVKNGIVFSSALGPEDYLVVENCRGRWYGAEAASYASTDDCFILSTIANIRLINSYLIGAGSQAKTVLTLQSSGGDLTKAKITLLGISGSSAINPGFLIENVSSTNTLTTTQVGNAWAYNVDSPWYMVVGGAGGNYPSGDFFGSSAIDTILGMTSYRGTVVVNPGTYIISGTASSSTNWTGLKFIGNKDGNKYPVFQLQLTASTADTLGNKFLVLGNHIEGIYFKGAGSVQSIRPSFSPLSSTTQNYSQTLTVRDCVFNDVTLFPMDLSGGSGNDELGVASQSIETIENCYFYQSNTYAPNMGYSSLSVPTTLNLTNCHFTGSLYPIGIQGTGSTRSTINLDRVFCDLTGSTFSISSTLAIGIGGAPSHVFINATNGTINVKNSEFLTTNTLACSSSLLSGTLLNAYEIFCAFYAPNVNLQANTFNGPNQAISSSTYSAVSCHIGPTVSGKVLNNHFVGGGVGLRVRTILGQTYLKENIVISGNNFTGGSTITNSISQTLLDMDINCNASSAASVLVSDNTFLSSNASTPYPCQHANVTGASYDTGAIVQIYCRGVNAKVTGNFVRGQLTAPGSNPFNHFSGIVVNTINSPDGATTLLTTAIVTDNNVLVTNNFNSGSATQSGSCCRVYTTTGLISNNNLTMRNVTTNINIACCLHLLNTKISSTGNMTVSHNSFGRSNESGSQFTLVGGYVYFAAGCTGGAIVTDNAFDSTTIDGVSDTGMVQSVSSSYSRVVSRNKNQTGTAVLRGDNGKFGTTISNPGPTYVVGYRSGGAFSALSLSGIYYNLPDATNKNVNFELTNADTGLGYDLTFVWNIPLYEIIPQGAYLVSVSVPIKVSSNVTGGGNKSIGNLCSIAAGTYTTEQTATITTGGSTLTFTAPTPAYLPGDASLANAVEVNWTVVSATSSTCQVGPMTVTYRW